MRPTSSPPSSRATRHRSRVSRPTTFSGHKVVVVKDTVTSGGKKTYVYKIVNDTPGEVSTVVFSHYGKGVALTVPPNAINLS